MLSLKNQFVFAPIKTGYSDGSGMVTEKHLAFYERRAKYLGAIIPEPFYLDKGLRELPTQMGIDNDDKIEGLKKLTALFHKTDTKAIAHLNHPGRMANPKIPGNYFISSTDKPCENGGATPKRMTREDIEKVFELFKQAAIRAQQADFDMIELQFGHGYLAAQFLSPFVNDSDGEYGGMFEHRVRFALQLFLAVKEAVRLPIIVRISGDEMIPNGIKLPEMLEFSHLLELAGAAAIHVSAGTVCSTPPWFFQHMFVPKGKTWEMAKQIKGKVNIPVIAVGQINEINDIEKIKKENISEYIAVGRSLVADPDFIGKYLGEVKGEIRPCLACAEGCLGGVRSGQGLQCLVNPVVGQEEEIFEVPAKTKKLAVVGGGLAGMEAALNLEKRGHGVDLYEKDKLGGQFYFAPLTPKKVSLGKLVKYYKNELEKSKVNILNKEATASDLMNYDEVILATGSIPQVPSIPGLDKFYWAEILLEENLPKDKKVLIIGGGLIGVDIATALILNNNKVILVKRTVDFGEDMEAIAKNLSLKMIEQSGAIFSDHTHIKKIEGKTVYAERNGEQIKFEDIDVFVVSTGMKSYNPLEEKLKDKVPVHVIGDAKKVGKAQDAIKSGYRVANLI
jgi:2,4-dienoyl-CoA reductase-like NADH-dependent reductase (Old Yellow Enzyme family)/thioredoxin reductase